MDAVNTDLSGPQITISRFKPSFKKVNMSMSSKSVLDKFEMYLGVQTMAFV